MFEPIGKHIRLVDERNGSVSNRPLLGVSIEKVFMPSVANTIGSNMANYKVVRRGQFACSLMQVRRDKKMPVALLRDHEEAIVSPAYPVFEIIDEDLLLPEYLMMWMLRPEFDREACFYAVGGVRGSLEWDDLCSMQLPVPAIEKQREIVKEYQTVVDRIRLNERLNEKLEEAAQAIYRQWFVEFEFPMTAGYAESIGKPELAGQPYKSSGGEMVYNEVLEQDIPKGWTNCDLSEKAFFRNGRSRPSTGGTVPVYGGNGIMGYASVHNAENVVTIGRVGVYCGAVHRVLGKCWVSDNAICAESRTGRNAMLYYLLKSLQLNERSEGTSQPLVTQNMLNGLQIPTYEEETEIQFDNLAEEFCLAISRVGAELMGLDELASILLSRLARAEGVRAS